MSWEEAALCRTGARPETLTQLSPCCVTLGYVFYFSKLESFHHKMQIASTLEIRNN